MQGAPACDNHRQDTGIEHAKFDSELALLIGNDGEGELRHALRRLDVLDPTLRTSQYIRLVRLEFARWQEQRVPGETWCRCRTARWS
jgi:hypothetical protein